MRTRRSILAALLGLGVLAPTADARPPIYGPVTVTSYCLSGVMADGSYTRRRSAAHNGLALGTRIRIVGHPPGPNGMRRYVVRDRIGWGTVLDLWQPTCQGAVVFGRRSVRFKLGWGRPR